MKGVGVELDDKAVSRPGAVEIAPVLGAIGERQGQPLCFEEADEGGLELGEQEPDIATHDAAQVAGAGQVGMERKDSLDGLGPKLVLDVGLVEGAGEGRRV